jgi:hypothetical protein
MTKRRMLWKKWIDWLDEEADSLADNLDEEDDEEEAPLYRDSYDRMEHHHNVPPGPMLVGPMGVVPLNEHNLPSRVYNFWMGHTNFNLGETEVKAINDTEGVETLEIYTRYRFRISVGQAFEEEEVMVAIENVLLKKEDKTEAVQTANVLDKVKKHLQDNYKYWAIFLLPDGQIDYKTGDSQDIVKQKIEAYPKKAEVLKSWEVNNGTEKKSKQRGIQAGSSKS